MREFGKLKHSMWSLKEKAELRCSKGGYNFLKAHAEEKWSEKSLQEKKSP